MATSIETPFALLQKPVKVLALDTVKTPHVTLGLVPKVFNPIDVITLVGKQLGVVDSQVMKVAHIQLTCSPKVSPYGMRVFLAHGSWEIFNERQEAYTAADHREVASGRG